MARFLIDEDLPRLLASLLREMGRESKDLRDLGMRGASDKAIFQIAQQRQSVVVSGDGDFGNLLLYPLGTHFGIVVVQYPIVMRTRQLARGNSIGPSHNR